MKVFREERRVKKIPPSKRHLYVKKGVFNDLLLDERMPGLSKPKADPFEENDLDTNESSTRDCKLEPVIVKKVHKSENAMGIETSKICRIRSLVIEKGTGPSPLELSVKTEEETSIQKNDGSKISAIFPGNSTKVPNLQVKAIQPCSAGVLNMPAHKINYNDNNALRVKHFNVFPPQIFYPNPQQQSFNMSCLSSLAGMRPMYTTAKVQDIKSKLYPLKLEINPGLLQISNFICPVNFM